MTARKDFLQSLTLGKKSEPTAEYAPSLRSPWRASIDYDRAQFCTDNPFRKRKWQENIDYFILNKKNGGSKCTKKTY
ncbi:hypothetical protein [Candidiatus Paracoxiella cheracis]|uniref:hypothetical protein n=1 Tax=Candidiatus Paracoxiella cheracis TaxID=3405120 RepID=UPI003BF5D302